MTYTLQTPSNLSSGFEKVALIQWIRDALLLDSRCTLVDSDYVASIPFIVIKYQDGNNLYDKVYVKLQVSTLTLQSFVYSDWNSTTHTSSYTSPTNTHGTFANTSSISGYVFKNSESLHLETEHSLTNTLISLTFFNPSTLRSYLLDTNNYPRLMFSYTNDLSLFRFPRFNQYNYARHGSFTNDKFCNTNAVDSRYGTLDISGNIEYRKKIEFYTNDNDGTHAISSEDIIKGYFTPHPRGYEFTDNSKTYRVITANLALRIA